MGYKWLLELNVIGVAYGLHTHANFHFFVGDYDQEGLSTTRLPRIILSIGERGRF